VKANYLIRVSSVASFVRGSMQALAAAGAKEPWLRAKGGLARIYAGQVLARAPRLAEGLMDGAQDLEGMAPCGFGPGGGRSAALSLRMLQ
jgi:hypothetical protein